MIIMFIVIHAVVTIPVFLFLNPKTWVVTDGPRDHGFAYHPLVSVTKQ